MVIRLIQLGVEPITLDFQGRAKSKICDMYRWRYGGKGSFNLKDIFSVNEKLESVLFKNHSPPSIISCLNILHVNC
jgi:hypothetical protein